MPKIALMPDIKIRIDKIKLHIPKNINKKSIMYFAITMALASARILGSLTPFGTALFASVCTAKTLVPTLVGLALGSLISHPSAISMCYVLAGAALALIYTMWDKPIRTRGKAILTGSILFLMRTTAAAKGGLLVYDLIMCFAEAFVSAMTVVAAEKAIPAIFTVRRRTSLKTEETVSIVIMMSALLLSFNIIPPVFGMKLGNILSMAMILILNLKCSVPTGAVIGIVAGAVNCIGTYNAGSIIGAYSFSALISSLFSRYGKWGVSLGFILANAIITILLNGSTEVLINIYEIIAAVTIFAVSPTKLIDLFAHISGISTTPEITTEDYSSGSLYREKLTKVSESLGILAKGMEPHNTDETIKREIGTLVNRIAERTCADCSLRYCCWNKKASETHKEIIKLISIAQNHGKVRTNDVGDALKNRCIRTENLVRSFNDFFELYRTNIIWQKRLADSKELAGMQMGNIARILGNIANEKYTDADDIIKAQIKTALDNAGVLPKCTSAYFNNGGNLMIEITFDNQEYREDTKFIIAPSLTEGLGIKIRFSNIKQSSNTVTLTYSICEKYCRTTGMASIKKHGEKVCGDSFTSMNLQNGTYVAAISDGMGSGESAAFESKNTIALLKNFLNCGFDIPNTIRLINSTLLMTAKDEIFSTLDVCNVDMHTGKANFIKIGGAATYIKTKDGVEKLSASSLPAGILEDIKPQNFDKKIDEEALIIMVSDGVESASHDDSWLKNRLKTMDVINPNIIAEKILELALYYNGGKAKDDMTVIATRIWREENV